jgi:hypothetical protein
MTAVLAGTAETVPQPDPAADGAAMPGGGGGLRARLVEQGYVDARFGGMPVLVGPDLAVQLRALREKQP